MMLAVLAVGCTNEDFNTPPVNEADAVVITAGSALSVDTEMESRATNDTWAADDLIGITMLSTSTPATPIYSNRQYKSIAAGSGSVQFNPEVGNEMYYPINGSEVTFKAYYPYTGLADLTKYALDVSGQSTLADLDLMTAVHENTDGTTANSKNKKEAHLVFHHRMTMVTVNLLTEVGSPITLDNNTKLAIKGMKTTGNYNLMTDDLTTDAASVQDINIPLNTSHSGRAILLPREAAEGVTFEVTLANGGIYTVALPANQDLEGGTQYTFNLTLKTTPTLITASIEDWTDGPTRSYDVVNIVAGTGTNSDFESGAELNLYTQDEGATGYSGGGTFAFDGTKWERNGSPLYWESFTGPTVDFKATSTYAPALNTTQVADYVVAETPDVPLYTGIHLEMRHVGAKATIKLSSSDGTYTAKDLDGATVTLPGYINAYIFDADAVIYTPDATATGDITPEKQGPSTPQDRVAILPPQEMAAGAALVKVVINGHTYNVTDASAFEYEAGKYHEIRLNIQKSGVTMTVSLKGWEDGDDHDTVVRIGTPQGTSGNNNILDGDELKLFTEVTSGTRDAVRGSFTYNGDSWTYADPGNTTPLFWEELPAEGTIYAQMERKPYNDSEGWNQSPDYIVATPVDNYGGKGATGTRIDFDMEHAVSQVRVVLRPSETYTAEQLKSAQITLPGYAIGGSLNNGVYLPGTGSGDIRLDVPNNDDVETFTYLQPQDIAAGQNVVMVTISASASPSETERTYPVTYNHNVEYNAGEITHLYITIVGSEVLVSVKVSGWEDQTPVELKYSFNEEDTNVEDFEVDDIITFHRLDGSGNVIDTKEHEVQLIDGKKELVPVDGGPWFRDDFKDGDRIVAVYPDGSSTYKVEKGDKTFNVDLNEKSDPTDSDNDVLVASDGVIKDGEANVNLGFQHVLSKVTVNIFRGAGFEGGEISGIDPMAVELVDFYQKGTVDVSNGTVSNLDDQGNVAPTKLTTPNTGVVVSPGVTKDAELSYQALILPQSKLADTVLVKITFGGNSYYAEYPYLFNFNAGEHNVLNITLAKTELKLSATIAPWVDGQSGSITIE